MYDAGIKTDIVENYLDIYNIFSKKGLAKENLPSETDRSAPSLLQARTARNFYFLQKSPDLAKQRQIV